MTTVTTGLRDSRDLAGNRKELLSRASEDGYLFMKGLLPRDAVLDLRRDILEICKRNGWLAPGSPLEDGVADVTSVAGIDPAAIAFCGVGIPADAYREVQKLQSFHSLAHRPELVSFYETLFGTGVLVHPRNIARVMLPPQNAPTPPHQDYIHIQGTTNVWTSWIPVGDVARELGGLSVLRGSNRDGILPVKAAEGAGSLEVYLCEVDYEWIEHDFQAGDVLTFTSMTVHKSIPNKLEDRIRISCDFRFQPADEPVEAKSLEVHCGVLGWDEVYERWTDETLKYYWKDMDLTMAEWDETIRWQKEKIC